MMEWWRANKVCNLSSGQSQVASDTPPSAAFGRDLSEANASLLQVKTWSQVLRNACLACSTRKRIESTFSQASSLTVSLWANVKQSHLSRKMHVILSGCGLRVLEPACPGSQAWRTERQCAASGRQDQGRTCFSIISCILFLRFRAATMPPPRSHLIHKPSQPALAFCSVARCSPQNFNLTVGYQSRGGATEQRPNSYNPHLTFGQRALITCKGPPGKKGPLNYWTPSWEAMQQVTAPGFENFLLQGLREVGLAVTKLVASTKPGAPLSKTNNGVLSVRTLKSKEGPPVCRNSQLLLKFVLNS